MSGFQLYHKSWRLLSIQTRYIYRTVKCYSLNKGNVTARKMIIAQPNGPGADDLIFAFLAEARMSILR
jgi:hypothetical protein